MKNLKVFIFLLVMPVVLLTGNSASHSTPSDFTQRIKQQYNNILDPLFAQVIDTLEAHREIIPLLHRKNKEEFKDIQNLISDISIETGFDHDQEGEIKKELHECLRLKVHDEMDKVSDIKGLTAENVEDFFHFSRMICNVTQGSDERCRDMIHAFEREQRNEIKKLRILDKARVKINAIKHKEEKEEFLDQLREQIILGAYPRK